MAFLRRKKSFIGGIKPSFIVQINTKTVPIIDTVWLLNSDLLSQTGYKYIWDDNEIWNDDNVAKLT